MARSVVLSALVLVTRLSLACTQPSFDAAPTVPLREAGFQTVADMNRDGIPDLVVADTATSGLRNVAVLLGTGNGTFKVAQEVDLDGFLSLGIASSDFNGDGAPDVAIFHDSVIAILLGKGDGTLLPPATVPVTGHAYPLLAADVTGDGKIDLLWAGGQSKIIGLLPGNGDGTFGTQRSMTMGSNTYGIAIGDFDGDGHIDIAATGHDDKTVVIATPDGSSFRTLFTATLPFKPYDLAAADFDRDGKLDLLAGGEENTLALFLGNGNATFRQRDVPLPGASRDSILIGDINADGVADLHLDTSESGSWWSSSYLGNGDGTFRRAGRTTMSDVRAFADFNRDGKLDMSGSSSTGHVAFYRGRGDGTFVTATALSVDYGIVSEGAFVSHAVAVGDFDGDGHDDLAAANSSANDITLLFGNGDGTFRSPVNVALAASPETLRGADLDGDGHPDLIVIHSNTFDVMLNTGTGSFSAPVKYSTTAPIFAFATGDVNGDARADIVAATSKVDGLLFLGNGGGTFAPPKTIALAAGNTPRAITIGDFDRDGRPDIITGSYRFNASTNLVFVKGHGDGTFDAPRPYDDDKYDVIALVAFDANADGVLDLVSTGIFIDVRLGKGDGTFNGPTHIAADPVLGAVTPGDWNGDGVNDLAVNGADDVVFLLGRGDGTFGDPIGYEAGVSLSRAVVGDLNGDGRPDVAVGNSLEGYATVTVLFNNCEPPRHRPARH